ncbi:MAG: 16S rRNA (cytosine(967)-C(5))-methyltransferase RsmB [Defluviitaleaceae bacterium]|nr:16S rRNA (cytosine(967)-C(5))-methyltransferase RsmB [Defluviitaleaceae bacterium]
MTARDTAVDILVKITRDGAYGNILLKNALDSLPDPRERAFATELVNGCLRNLIFLDHVIGSASSAPLNKIKPVIMAILRAGAYQILYMERVPASAAIDEAVKLAKRRKFGGLAGFVNAVLRSVARRADEVRKSGGNLVESFGLPDMVSEPLRRLSIEYSMPRWIVEMAAAQRGLGWAEAFCRGSAYAPYVGLCVNTLRTDRPSLIEILKSEGAEIADEVFHENFISVRGFSGIAGRKSFLDGLYHVMDPGAAAPVDMLDPRPGDEILDMCAAPGGKSLYAAYKMENRGRVTAWDIHPRKAGLISEAAWRLGATIIEAGEMDARRPSSGRKYSKILLDAPCSGLGVLKKKPDIKYSLKEKDIAPLVALQRELLASAAGLCAAGGRVVYSTCTVSAEKNEENAAWFAEKFGFSVEGEECTLPARGTDGFYSVKMIKNK